MDSTKINACIVFGKYSSIVFERLRTHRDELSCEIGDLIEQQETPQLFEPLLGLFSFVEELF